MTVATNSVSAARFAAVQPTAAQLRFVRDAVLLQPAERWARTITEFGEVPALEWGGLVALLREPNVVAVCEGAIRHPADRRAAERLRRCVSLLELWHAGQLVLSFGWSATDDLILFQIVSGHWSQQIFGFGMLSWQHPTRH